MIHIAAFAIAFLRIYTRAAQQLNVVHFKWARVPLYSFAMSLCDALLWAGAGYLGASGDMPGLVVYGLLLGAGGTLGTWLAMYQHKRWCDIHDIERVGL